MSLEEKKVAQVKFTSIVIDSHVVRVEWRGKGVNLVHSVDDLVCQHSHDLANRGRR